MGVGDVDGYRFVGTVLGVMMGQRCCRERVIDE